MARLARKIYALESGDTKDYGVDNRRMFATEELAWRWAFKRFGMKNIDRRHAGKPLSGGKLRGIINGRRRWVMVTEYVLHGKLEA